MAPTRQGFEAEDPVPGRYRPARLSFAQVIRNRAACRRRSHHRQILSGDMPSAYFIPWRTLTRTWSKASRRTNPRRGYSMSRTT